MLGVVASMALARSVAMFVALRPFLSRVSRLSRFASTICALRIAGPGRVPSSGLELEGLGLEGNVVGTSETGSGISGRGLESIGLCALMSVPKASRKMTGGSMMERTIAEYAGIEGTTNT